MRSPTDSGRGASNGLVPPIDGRGKLCPRHIDAHDLKSVTGIVVPNWFEELKERVPVP